MDKKKLIIITAAVLILALIGGGIYTGISSMEKQKAKKKLIPLSLPGDIWRAENIPWLLI